MTRLFSMGLQCGVELEAEKIGAQNLRARHLSYEPWLDDLFHKISSSTMSLTALSLNDGLLASNGYDPLVKHIPRGLKSVRLLRIKLSNGEPVDEIMDDLRALLASTEHLEYLSMSVRTRNPRSTPRDYFSNSD